MKLINRQSITVLVVSNHSAGFHRLVMPVYLVVGIASLAFGMLTLFTYTVWNYYEVSSRLELNKKLQGENFKLRQDLDKAKMQLETLDWNMERVQNYVRKLQNIMRDEDPISVKDRKRSDRAPSSLDSKTGWDMQDWQLQLGKVQRVSYQLETTLSTLQYQLRDKTALLDATPSQLPIDGWVSSQYGNRRHPFDGEVRQHRGVDLAAEPGTPVKAPANGKVIFSGQRGGYGKVVILDHGFGFRTIYGHNSKLFVHFGDPVKRGDVIAEVGSTGMSTGPHLHYEVRKNGQPVDPNRYVPKNED